MKKISLILLITLLSISLVGCQTETGTETKTNTTEVEEAEVEENKKSKPKKIESDKIYGVGEEAFVLDENGEKAYSLKINSIKTVDNFEYKDTLPESNRKQILKVDYTYKNISKDDELGLHIYIDDLYVADITGEVAQCSPYTQKDSKEITPGLSCTAEGYYGLANESDKIKIVMKSGMYNTVLTFEAPVE